MDGWMDGVFLAALKAGDWVLLDEMNLASQSVLEGLNSVLDHRKRIFIPELNETFHCPPSFRIFACQVIACSISSIIYLLYCSRDKKWCNILSLLIILIIIFSFRFFFVFVVVVGNDNAKNTH
jgi:hypothetical protein